MASFFDDEAEVGTTDDEDEMETEGTLKVRKFKVNKDNIFLETKYSKWTSCSICLFSIAMDLFKRFTSSIIS